MSGVIPQPQRWHKRSTKPLCSTVLSFTAWLYFSIRDCVYIEKFEEALKFFRAAAEGRSASSSFRFLLNNSTASFSQSMSKKKSHLQWKSHQSTFCHQLNMNVFLLIWLRGFWVHQCLEGNLVVHCKKNMKLWLTTTSHSGNIFKIVRKKMYNKDVFCEIWTPALSRSIMDNPTWLIYVTLCVWRFLSDQLLLWKRLLQ